MTIARRAIPNGLIAQIVRRESERLRMQRAELEYLAGSEAMQTAIAENYVGLPL